MQRQLLMFKIVQFDAKNENNVLYVPFLDQIKVDC